MKIYCKDEMRIKYIKKNQKIVFYKMPLEVAFQKIIQSIKKNLFTEKLNKFFNK